MSEAPKISPTGAPGPAAAQPASELRPSASPEAPAFEHRYRTLVSNLPVGVFVSRPDGRFLEANDIVVKMAGYDTLEEFLSISARDLYAEPGARDQVLATLRAHGTARDIPVLSRRKDGTVYWVSMSAVVQSDAAGNVESILGIVEDITARKATLEALHRSEARYRTVVETSPDAISVTDLQGWFLTINARFSELFGFENADELGRLGINSADLVVETDLAAMKATGPELMHGGRVTGLEVRVKRKDGTVFPAEFSTRLLRDEAGEPAAFLSVIRDVTDRDRVARALTESEARLRDAQRMARFGHYVLDVPTGTWTSSEGLDEVFGIDADYPKTVGSWLDLVHPDERDEMRAYLGEHIQTRHLPFDKSYRVVRPRDGQEAWVHGMGRLEYDAQGALLRMFGTIQDVTEAKRAELAHMLLEERLRQSQKMEAIGLLAGGVAHDLNNMLTPILGNGDLLLLDPSLAPGQHTAIDEILRAAQRAQSLVRQLMAFGRKQTLEMQSLDLNQVITSFKTLLRRTLRESIHIELRLEPSCGRVHADRGQLEQVLLNLAINGQDAMPEGGTLLVETGDRWVDTSESASQSSLPPGPYVMLSVRDTGSGMDAYTQERIFEPFFTTKEKGRGTGLGLATVYGIVRQHGGDIRVHSHPGEGTRFDILLPATLEPVAVAPPSQAPGPVQRGGETILIAEDDPAVRQTTTMLLERLGYRILAASTIEETLQIAEQQRDRIDLLLTDVVMPEMSGKALFTALRAMIPGLKVVYMSGYSSDVIQDHGALEDGVSFLQKPFTLKSLADRLRQVLDA